LGAAPCESYLHVQYLVNQEDEKYKHIGTALIESLLRICQEQNYSYNLQLISLGVSRMFFFKLGFIPLLQKSETAVKYERRLALYYEREPEEFKLSAALILPPVFVAGLCYRFGMQIPDCDLDFSQTGSLIGKSK
jgi:hypothetical protein